MINSIDIILPFYNQAKTLVETLESIANQSFKDFRLIFINDGSTEDISGLIKHYSEIFNIEYLENEKNMGLVFTLNRGLKLVNAKYITWTSADNIMEPNWLLELKKSLDKHPDASSTYSDYSQIDEQGKFIQWMSKGKYLLNGQVNFGPSFMYTIEAVGRVGLFDTNLQMLEDRDYSIRMVQDGPVIWTRKRLYKYRMHTNSLTAKFIKKEISSPDRIFYEKHLNIIQKPQKCKVYIEPSFNIIEHIKYIIFKKPTDFAR